MTGFPLPALWWLLWCLCRDSCRRDLCNLCSSRLKLMSILLWKVVQCHMSICRSSLWYIGGNIYLTTDSSWSLLSQWFHHILCLQMLLSGNSYSFLVFSYSFLTCISSVSLGVVLDSCHSLCQCPGETTHGQHHLNALLPTAWCSSSASKPFLAHPWWTFQLTQPPQRGIFPKVWQKPHCLQQQFHLQSCVVHVLPPSSCSTVCWCSSTNSQPTRDPARDFASQQQLVRTTQREFDNSAFMPSGRADTYKA